MWKGSLFRQEGAFCARVDHLLGTLSNWDWVRAFSGAEFSVTLHEAECVTALNELWSNLALKDTHQPVFLFFFVLNCLVYLRSLPTRYRQLMRDCHRQTGGRQTDHQMDRRRRGLTKQREKGGNYLENENAVREKSKSRRLMLQVIQWQSSLEHSCGNYFIVFIIFIQKQILSSGLYRNSLGWQSSEMGDVLSPHPKATCICSSFYRQRHHDGLNAMAMTNTAN